MSLGTKLHKLRQEKKLSQTQVALELDVSQTAYGKWESDQMKPGIDNLLRIANFYETDIYDLLEDKEGNNNFSNSYDNSSVSNEISTTNYYVSEKLIEQYEIRLKEKEEFYTTILKEKDEQIALLKSLLDKK